MRQLEHSRFRLNTSSLVGSYCTLRYENKESCYKHPNFYTNYVLTSEHCIFSLVELVFGCLKQFFSFRMFEALHVFTIPKVQW